MSKNNFFAHLAIQQIRLEDDFDLINLQTVYGQQIKIEFAGWHNTGNGPDFKEVRLQINEQVLLGAVEIHVHSYERYSHQHERNKDYNEVVLHVVLYHNENRKIEREDGRIVPALELAHFLNKEPSFSEIEKIRLKILWELSGPCGDAAFDQGTGTLKIILGHAAERVLKTNYGCC